MITIAFLRNSTVLKRSDNQKLREGDMQVPDVAAQLKTPGAANRVSPLGFAHPSAWLQSTKV